MPDSEADAVGADAATPEAGTEAGIPGIHPEDDVIPVSPGLRRTKTTIALILLAAIIAFLVLFIATSSSRSDSRGFFGAGEGTTAAWPATRG